MSNLFKSGLITYTGQNTLVIDANKNRVIRQLEEQNRLKQEALAARTQEEHTDDGFQSLEIENIDMEDVRKQANAVFEEAQSASERLLEEARADALLLKEEAKQNGYEEGYQKGLSEAKAQLEAQEAELQGRYDKIRQQLEEDYEQEIRDAEPKLVDVVCRLLHKITGVLTEDYQDVVVHMVDRAMQDLEGCEKVVVKVSEEDYADVYSRFDWLSQQVNSNVEVELISDIKLGRQECLIETETGIINCSLEEQLKHLITSLKLLAQM